ncbi:hypothetical protein Mp_1g06670 [Marchantia polymorpha subsp. ruderalis]|uniref:Uncharacterized protein n=2 Tax=Marchantia polymorpha TaxID=3197 RepID=A0AAF6AMA0_MARPO|nr:hypothetical protein MARPO_0043s0059 [Marchantia polymorpha]BBM97570.1 hypothetical protein Mp_1g06670 [Marchantia polymorpha subsp. ruderalis]|eukprot:PTQ39811.1 hypothetical protein MARPO_0043s0059 [Marchantia polymorpha]
MAHTSHQSMVQYLLSSRVNEHLGPSTSPLIIGAYDDGHDSLALHATSARCRVHESRLFGDQKPRGRNSTVPVRPDSCNAYVRTPARFSVGRSVGPPVRPSVHPKRNSVCPRKGAREDGTRAGRQAYDGRDRRKNSTFMTRRRRRGRRGERAVSTVEREHSGESARGFDAAMANQSPKPKEKKKQCDLRETEARAQMAWWGSAGGGVVA